MIYLTSKSLRLEVPKKTSETGQEAIEKRENIVLISLSCSKVP